MTTPRSALAASAATVASVVALSTGALAACSSSSGPSAAPTASSSTPSRASTPSGRPGKSASSPPSAPASAHPTEFNPPGDIPDNAVFVDHVAPSSTVHFTVPEGWARKTAHGVTTYTDKYNSISIETRPAKKPPTVASARRVDVPEIRRSVANFQAGPITDVTRKHGTAVHLAYLMDSAPNPVTGKVVRDAVERFEFWHKGEEAILTLAGPQGADNVDPWRIVSDSLRWQ
jgi:hypothetical protein